jgi:Zn finger protein HypA/HybF involved in hydrogenase expression
MHESILVYRILGEIKPKLPPGCELKCISLLVGEYSCVNTSTLTQLYDIAKKNSFADKSRLKMTIVKNSSDITIKSIEVKR